MRQSRHLIFLTLVAVLIIGAAIPIVQAAAPDTSDFSDMINLLKSMISIPAQLFDFSGWLDTPARAFGFLMFLFWILLITIFNIGAQTIFPARQAQVIAIIISTITVVMLYFQQALVMTLIGDWVWIIVFALYFGAFAGIMYAAFRLGNSTVAWLVRAGLFILGFFMAQAMKGFVTTGLSVLGNAATSYTYTGTRGVSWIAVGFLIYYLKFHALPKVRD